MILIYIFVLFFGLMIGSFLNVLIFRLGRRGGIVMGRSQCQKCLNNIVWYDLFPLASFLALKGKCRNCKASISIVYPIVEALSGLLLLSLFMNHWPDIGISFFFEAFTIFGLLVIIFSDLIYFIIPDKVVFPLIAVSFIHIFWANWDQIRNLALSAFIFFSFFAIIYIVSRGKWMGFGDAKLAFLLGLVLGYPFGFWAIVLSVWAALLVGLILMALGRANMGTALPLGAFLGSAIIIFIIFKDVIQTQFPWLSFIL